MGVNYQLQAPATFPPGKQRRHPLNTRLGGHIGGFDALQKTKYLLVLTGLELRIIQKANNN
jgi:hypothetical protein